MIKLLGVFVVFWSLGAYSDLQYTDLAFNRLQLSELETLLLEYPQQKVQISFFKSEALFLSGKPHAAQEILKSFEKVCAQEKILKLAPREEIACFLMELGLGPPHSDLTQFFKRPQIEKRLRLIASSVFSFEERAYLEGRILWQIPESLGGNYGKSLLALESLKRLKPQLSSVDYFRGQIFNREGKTELAGRAFQEALSASPPDPRAKLRKRFDRKPGGGFMGFLANPAGGYGIRAGYQENDWGDQNRHWRLIASVQSRGVYSGEVFFKDGESFPPWTGEIKVQGALEIDQFFGLGPLSQRTDLTEVEQARLQLRLGMRKDLGSFFVRASLGGFLRKPSNLKGPLQTDKKLMEDQKSLLPEFEFGVTEKNREIKVTLFGAQESFFSSHTFSGGLLEIHSQWQIGAKSHLSLMSAYRFVTETSPFAFLTTLSGNLSLPGIRPGRYRSTQGGGASLKWESHLSSQWSWLAFGNIAHLGNPWLGGGGVGLAWGTAPFKSQIEWGYFAGENIILAGLRWADE